MNGLRASDDCTDAPAGFYAPAGHRVYELPIMGLPAWTPEGHRQRRIYIPIVVPWAEGGVRTETVEQTVEQTCQLPSKLRWTIWRSQRLRSASRLPPQGLPLSAVSLDLASRRRLDACVRCPCTAA